MKSRINDKPSNVRPIRTASKHPAMEQRSLGLLGVLHDVRHAFEGLCAQVGQAVLEQLMEEDRTALCGAKGVPQERRSAVRGGTTPASVVLAGRRIAVQRQRVRDLQRGELALPNFVWASERDPLERATLQAVAAGVSTRRYAGTQPELPQALRAAADATSKSSVSRRFVALSQRQLNEWVSGSIAGLDLPAVMIDGIHLGDSVILVALGIDAQGNKHVLGLREGSTENTRVVKALRRGITECFGRLALVQRCQEHKRRNVLEPLPEAMQLGTGKAMRQAWDGHDAKLAAKRLHALADSLQARHPGAAASLREGLTETLTVQGLGIAGALYRTLRTTNPIENLNGTIARYTRNVKRWKDASMVRRWSPVPYMMPPDQQGSSAARIARIGHGSA